MCDRVAFQVIVQSRPHATSGLWLTALLPLLRPRPLPLSR